MSILAVLVAKLIHFTVRLFKLGGGSAAPGLIALKIDPELITHLASKIPQNIVITGTNGKTTTSKLIAHFAKVQKLKIIHNQTGSNLERGIASTLIHSSNSDLGIWELDEAAFNTVAAKLNPTMIIFLNTFRDQLDRYGEVDSVIKNWEKTISKLKKDTVLIVNGDDTNTKKLASGFKGRVIRFGLETDKIAGESSTDKTAIKLNIQAQDIDLDGLSGSSFELKIENLKLKISLPLPGIYNIYNFLAAFAAGLELKLNSGLILDSLKSFTPAFGRAEKFDHGVIYLIKNPVGATQILHTLVPNLKSGDVLLIALNDQVADGADVSWIWDVDWEKLKLKVVCSGTRAYDLALRLKYAEIDEKNITIQPNLEQAFGMASQDLTGKLYILPTYTAMLELQKLLAKSGVKKNYWEEI